MEWNKIHYFTIRVIRCWYTLLWYDIRKLFDVVYGFCFLVIVRPTMNVRKSFQDHKTVVVLHSEVRAHIANVFLVAMLLFMIAVPYWLPITSVILSHANYSIVLVLQGYEQSKLFVSGLPYWLHFVFCMHKLMLLMCNLVVYGICSGTMVVCSYLTLFVSVSLIVKFCWYSFWCFGLYYCYSKL